MFHGSATPIPLPPAERTKANEAFNHWAESVSAFEHSRSYGGRAPTPVVRTITSRWRTTGPMRRAWTGWRDRPSDSTALIRRQCSV